ncbi:hypothetical protein pEaSNUABM5_00079 [Erwinia phage pEa_SNUABM_5]|uniref:Uncharacterized protein n=1 Tax=Erwinia phage pEa_SNUABM_5 TaxID=2797313 RepID=A0A7T8EPD6_9CAUD|nr:hypothetical protein MPK73_gp079 [Erwinia phage pEa_SNUABM_5]QQO90221.1 hypothetical protein pEaSNUABM5_00079 [Erwinia phage pEa_SNUABM_5]
MKISLALQAKEYVGSVSASGLQEAYQDFFRGKLEQYGVTSPAQLEDDQLSKFFNEISTEWAAQKRAMYKDGEITKEQL